MAAKTPARSVHATLSTTVADSVTWTAGTGYQGPYNTVIIENRDASNVLYVRFDGTTAVAAADNTYVVPASAFRIFSFPGGNSSLSVVGSGNAYSVEGF